MTQSIFEKSLARGFRDPLSKIGTFSQFEKHDSTNMTSDVLGGLERLQTHLPLPEIILDIMEKIIFPCLGGPGPIPKICQFNLQKPYIGHVEH